MRKVPGPEVNFFPKIDEKLKKNEIFSKNRMILNENQRNFAKKYNKE